MSKKMSTAMVRFYTSVDLEMKTLSISCSKGCSHCCYHPIWVTPMEGGIVEEHLGKLPAQKFRPIKERWMEWYDTVLKSGLDMLVAPHDVENYGKLYFQKRIRCPFLQEDNLCSIYDVRPLVCRSYFTTASPETCLSAATDPSFDEFYTRKRAELDRLRTRFGFTEKSTGTPLLFAGVGGLILNRRI